MTIGGDDRAMEQEKALPWYRKLLDIRNPWIWLAYLPLFFVPWIGQPPSKLNLVVSLAGLAVFLLLYFYAERVSKWEAPRPGEALPGRRAVIAPAIATFVLSLGLIPFGGNWPVISIFACAMAADLRPARDAARLSAIFILVSIAAFVWLGLPWYFVAMFGVFEFMVVFGKMSGIALAEKNWVLLRAQEEVRRLAQTAERERIARDLHDLLGRTLTLIALKSDLAVKLGDGEAARREMKEVGDAAREGLAQVRGAIAGMTSAGLAHEIAASRDALAAAGIACEVEGGELVVPPAAGAVLAMALREGVTNVIRHAGAKHCRIAIEHDGENVKLVVSDDGQSGRFREGAGLTGMRARLAAAGGRLRIRAGHGGTRIAAAIPAGPQ
jgi:two-component system sensor histidine kinase DesK